jgi:hypothetical protein
VNGWMDGWKDGLTDTQIYHQILLLRDFVKFLGAFTKLRNATIRFVMSIRLFAWISAPTGRIFIKFDMCVFFKNLLRKFKFH